MSRNRMANQRIEALVDYIQKPHSSRSIESNEDPYFYGMSESQWREAQDLLHRDIQGRRVSNRDIREQLGVSLEEANTIINHSMRGREARHVNKGVPHAWTTEEVARQALLGSGIQASRLNSSNHMATDLEAMIGNLNRYIDVQMNYTPGGMNNRIVIPVMTSMPTGTAPRIQRESGLDTSLERILLNAHQITDGQWFRDKLMQSRRSQQSNLQPSPSEKIKDMLIVGNYDRDQVNNRALRPQQGHYNPQAPRDLSVISLDPIRQKVLGMSPREIRRDLGGIVRFYDDIPRMGGNKIKLELPISAIQQLGAQATDVLDPQVIHELNRLSL